MTSPPKLSTQVTALVLATLAVAVLARHLDLDHVEWEGPQPMAKPEYYLPAGVTAGVSPKPSAPGEWIWVGGPEDYYIDDPRYPHWCLISGEPCDIPSDCHYEDPPIGVGRACDAEVGATSIEGWSTSWCVWPEGLKRPRCDAAEEARRAAFGPETPTYPERRPYP